jgi:S1-C subfamily serine protease
MTDPAAPLLSSFSADLAGIVAKTKPAVVSVHSHRSRASGFVWKPGLVVTADEALADEGEVSIKLPDGTTRPASIAGRDHTTDIALLRFEAKDIAPIKLSAVVPELGSLSIVVAAEHGVPTAALGAVSLAGDRWRSLRGGEIDARIELDVRLPHSHQGGLALNASGEALGMAVQGVRRVLVIPAATIDRVAGRLETHGRISRGWGRAAARQARRWHRRDGHECRQDGPLGHRRHPARRRDRRLQRRKTLGCAIAVADTRPR